MPKDYLAERLRKLRKQLKKEDADGLLITNPVNVRYLSGFTGDDSWLIVGPEQAALLTDSRYTEQAQAECLHAEVVQRSKSLRDAAVGWIKKQSLMTIGFEDDSVSYRQWQALKDDSIDWRPLSGVVENLRLIKDVEEIKHIRKAVDVAEQCFLKIRDWIKPGMTEAEVSDEIEMTLRGLGAAGSSFETIVLFGERSSLPHGRPSRGRTLQPGEQVLIDWGARLELYNSDLTRMLLPSKINDRLKRIYSAVLEAQQLALEAARPDMPAAELDAVARDRLKKSRLGNRFGHGLGHGVGMNIHEKPGVTRGNTAELRPGMVFTVEPGAYIPGWGGVRIEDMVQLTRTGRKILTSLPKTLEEVCVL